MTEGIVGNTYVLVHVLGDAGNVEVRIGLIGKLLELRIE